jgi:TonB-linked SusC/RagA family outer membrane protein
MKKLLLLCFSFVFVASSLLAQERVISGKVTSVDDGSTLPGVNVVLKGTTNGAVTDSDGNYKISISGPGGVLSFSFIGFKSLEVEIGERSTVDVQLESDVQQLSEVVVTGLGWQAETRTLGYSVAQVKSESINQAKALNAFTGLSGKVAGLQIRTINNGLNPQTRVTLRGNRSLTGNNQALVVLDGIIVPNNTLNSINNNDIENVTILKGASAAAIYGSDATNGVLLITLRKGTGKTPQITFSNTTQLEQVSYMPKLQTGWGPGTNFYSKGYISFENQSFGPAFDGSTQVLGKQLEDGTTVTAPYSALPDAKRDVWDTGVTQQNYLSFSAGDDDSRFDMSLQNVSQTGIVPRDLYRRTGIRVAGSQNVGKFQGAFSILYNHNSTETNASPNGFYWDVINSGANIDIKSYRNWRPFTLADGSLNPANPNNYFNDYYENPWYGLDAYRANSRNNEITGYAQIAYKATDWLNFTYRAGLTGLTSYGKTTAEKFDFRDFPVNTAHIFRAKNYPGFVNDFSTNARRVQSDIIATANKSFSKFDLQVIAGAQVLDDFAKFINVGTTNLVVPEVYNVTNRTGEPTVGEQNFNIRRFGVYGDITLTYNNYLTLHLAGRNDQTSLLSKGNNTYFYPAVDMAFVASDAIPFLKNISFLSYFKLTAGWAKVGQVNVQPYGLAAVFTPGGGFPFGSTAGFTRGNILPDPNLQPEFLNNLEFSSDIRFLNDRLNFGVSYYKQNSTNQTVEVSTSASTGYTAARINAGEIENSGIEFEFSGTIYKMSNGLEIGGSANYANRSTKVVSLYQGLSELNIGGNVAINIGQTQNLSGSNVFAIVGQQYPVIKVDTYKKDNQGRVIIDPETGYPYDNTTGLVVAGRTEPRHVVGVSPWIKFKGFRLDVTAEYRTGNIIWNNSGESMTFTGVAKITDTYERERFIFPNSVIETVNTDGSSTYTPNTNIAVEDGGLGFWDNHFDAISENYVTSAAFWKVREVSLSYKFPTSMLSKTKFIKAATLSLVGRNLLMWLPASNLYTDPEFNTSNTNVVGLNTIGITPPTRTYGLNVDITF